MPRGLARIGVAITAVLGAALLFGASTVVAPAATAATSSSGLGVTLSWVNATTAATVTTLEGTTSSETNKQDRLVGLQIGYSCKSGPCTNAKISLSAMPMDPYYSAYQFAALSSETLPDGATLSGSDKAGWTITFGEPIVSGTSAAFTMLFTYQARASFPAPQSFFPDGDSIGETATLSADDMTAVSATSAVTWKISTPDPAVSFFPASASGTATLDAAHTGSNYTYDVYMTSGCYWSDGGHGDPQHECAASYTTTQSLPSGAVFVSATGGGVYDAATNSVSWTASGKNASVGFGKMTTGGSNEVVVQFPSSLITDQSDCVISENTTVTTDVTYLSGKTGTASTTQAQSINGCTEFTSGSALKFSTYSVTNPNEVWAGTTQHWTVRAINTSNVPAVGVVSDTFDQDGLSVTKISTADGSAFSATATLSNGDEVTVSDVTTYSAPSGTTIQSATVTTVDIPGLSTSETSKVSSYIAVYFTYTVTSDVPQAGYTRSNTASVTLTFPQDSSLDDVGPMSASATVAVDRKPAMFSPTLAASVAGGGNPTPGKTVTFSAAGSMSNQDSDLDFEPQYVFIAPAGWDITAGSASIAGVTDADFTYGTVTIGGDQREEVVASRPDGVSWGINSTWPTLTVKATPDVGVVAGAIATADFYMGDKQDNYATGTAIWGASSGNAWGSYQYIDEADIDADGNTSESFAYTTAALTIGSTSSLSVTKELCVPDTSTSDGCDWETSTSSPVELSADATVRYRVLVTNTGTSPLSGAVAYDLLPHVGDTGASDGTSDTERGSTVSEVLSSIDETDGMTTAYSSSSNPCRPEVYASVLNCVDDWSGSSAADTDALRMTLVGSLAPDASASVTFDTIAASLSGVTDGALACNSASAGTESLPATDSGTLCVSLREDDLAASVPNDTISTQQGQITKVPFTFSNMSGSPDSSQTVSIDVPTGVTVASRTFDGWTCSSDSTGSGAVSGPAVLRCTSASSVVTGTPLTLDLPVIVHATSAVLKASIASAVFDSDESNNAVQVTLMAPTTPSSHSGNSSGSRVSGSDASVGQSRSAHRHSSRHGAGVASVNTGGVRVQHAAKAWVMILFAGAALLAVGAVRRRRSERRRG